MIKVENVDVWGFEHAIRGMRNPMNSWDKIDSGMKFVHGIFNDQEFVVGENDLDLMRRLYKAGSEHRKYLRQIFVSMDITAPLYWWKEMDQYRIGVTTDSCSTMHKLADRPLSVHDFSMDSLQLGNVVKCEEDDGSKIYVEPEFRVYYKHFTKTISELNQLRENYLKTNDKKWWRLMIEMLPSSYNQRRTVTMNYENVVNMIRQRENHKLDEWRAFVTILLDLPYIKEITEND